MHGEDFFFQAFVYLAAAVVSVPVAKRLGLGSVLGYLIAGVVIGPYVLGLIGEEGQDVMHFAEFGVVMMLFLIGLELEPERLWNLRGPILGLGGLQVGLSTLAVMGIAMALGQSWRAALALGLILALSSTAMVLQTLDEKGLMRTDAGQSAFSVLLFQDIAVIPILALLPLLAPVGGAEAGAVAAAGAAGANEGGHGSGHGNAGAEHATTWVEGLPAWAETVAVLGAVVLVILVGRFLTRPVFRTIAATGLRELFTAAALLLVIGIALLMTRVGLSPALGTFLAGVVLANSEYRHELEGDIEPFKGLLLGLFFIAVGASIDFALLASQASMIALVVVGLVALKVAVLAALSRGFGMSLDQGILFTFSLAQGGEFAFVLFSYADQHQVLPPDLSTRLIAAVALSMALTPLLLLVAEKLVLPRIGTREGDDRPQDVIDAHEDCGVIIAGFGSFGSVVGRFLRANGFSPTVLDFDSDRVELLRKLGIKVFYGDATRYDLLHSAGADESKILIAALDDADQNLELIETAGKHFPHLEIYARATERTDAYEMIDMGLGRIYRETLDSALRLGVDAAQALGVRHYAALRSARRFRSHDEDSIRDLAQLRHDRQRYLSRARERIRLLEDVIASEDRQVSTERDVGWDVESLRADVAEMAEKKNDEDAGSGD